MLYGEDALRFEREMERVDNMSEEERRANWEKVCEQYDAFCKKWNVTVKI